MEVDLLELQKRVLQNKVNHGFNTTDIKFELLLLYGEMAELFKGYLKRDQENIAEELADIGIYLLGISEMLGEICRKKCSKRWLSMKRESTTKTGPSR